ncbi:MAG: hypothetical protein CVV34_01095 [Methanomicrobiales archaeon HGW-Methanomicrobiales-5]|nr:MAG: hypothetical protein CVV34_01095 [Methanomicrobiales archaeon HGW-Methanomicrobiales-5]
MHGASVRFWSGLIYTSNVLAPEKYSERGSTLFSLLPDFPVGTVTGNPQDRAPLPDIPARGIRRFVSEPLADRSLNAFVRKYGWQLIKKKYVVYYWLCDTKRPDPADEGPAGDFMPGSNRPANNAKTVNSPAG